MKKTILSAVIAVLAILAVVATVAAADPAGDRLQNRDRDRDTVPTILGLSQAEIMELRHDGMSLAQIAEREGVDPQGLIDALAARWMERIEVRVQNGALSEDEAAQLREQIEVRAKDAVYSTTLGGMQGAAVGAGPHNGQGGNAAGMGTGAGIDNGRGDRYQGAGTGICDGSGPNGSGRP
jgi:hypothetical protein